MNNPNSTNTVNELLNARNAIVETVRGSEISQQVPPWMERSFTAINRELRRRGYDAPDDPGRPVSHQAYVTAAEVEFRNRLRKMSLLALRDLLRSSQLSDSDRNLVSAEIERKVDWRDRNFQRQSRNYRRGESPVQQIQVIVDELMSATGLREQISQSYQDLVAHGAAYSRELDSRIMNDILNPPLVDEQRGNNMDDARVAVAVPPPTMPVPAQAFWTEVDTSVPEEPVEAIPVSKPPKTKAPAPVAVITNQPALLGTPVAELKKNGYALLTAWINSGKLSKHASNVTDEDFLAKNKKAIMHITVIADEYNLTDADLMAEDFIETIKEKHSRFIQVQKDIRSIIEAKKSTVIKAKETRILTSDNGYAQTMMKSFVNMTTPMVHPTDNIKSEITQREAQITDTMRQVDRYYREYTNMLTQAERVNEEMKTFKQQLEALKNAPGVDLFANIRSFCMKADGVNFPFKFKYGFKEGESSYKFIFGKPAFIYKDPDSGVSRKIAPLDIVVQVIRDGSLWKYTITGKREDDLERMMRFGGDIFTTDQLKYYHAHINPSGNICLGNAGDMINKMRTDFNKMGDSLMIIDSLIKTYNPGSPYQSLSNAFYGDNMLIYKLVQKTRDGDGGFQRGLRDQMCKGEITVQEYIRALADKVLECITYRALYLSERKEKIDLWDAMYKIRDCAVSSGFKKLPNRPFEAPDEENYFLDYMRNFFNQDNVLAHLADKIGSLRPDLYAKGIFDTDAMDFLLDYMKHHFDCYLRYVDTAIDNVALNYAQDPTSMTAGSGESISGHNIKFKDWFLTKRKV